MIHCTTTNRLKQLLYFYSILTSSRASKKWKSLRQLLLWLGSHYPYLITSYSNMKCNTLNNGANEVKNLYHSPFAENVKSSPIFSIYSSYSYLGPTVYNSPFEENEKSYANFCIYSINSRYSHLGQAKCPYYGPWQRECWSSVWKLTCIV